MVYMIRTMSALTISTNCCKHISLRDASCTYPCSKTFNEIGLKDVPKRNPVEEPQQSVECSLDQTRFVRLFQNFAAELKDLREFSTHRVLEVFRLHLGHLLRGIIKDLFTRKTDHLWLKNAAHQTISWMFTLSISCQRRTLGV